MAHECARTRVRPPRARFARCDREEVSSRSRSVRRIAPSVPRHLATLSSFGLAEIPLRENVPSPPAGRGITSFWDGACIGNTPDRMERFALGEIDIIIRGSCASAAAQKFMRFGERDEGITRATSAETRALGEWCK